MPRVFALLAAAALLGACARTEPELDPAADLSQEADTAPAVDTLAVGGASAMVRDSAGRPLGAVTLRETADGVTLAGSLSGLSPGEHGFHIHHTGACEPFSGAGSHFDPAGSDHGFDAASGPHAGDLRNLVADQDGAAAVQHTNDRVTLQSGESALLDEDGSALVIHAGPDDYASQPSGGSGGPVACGVIEG